MQVHHLTNKLFSFNRTASYVVRCCWPNIMKQLCHHVCIFDRHEDTRFIYMLLNFVFNGDRGCDDGYKLKWG